MYKGGCDHEFSRRYKWGQHANMNLPKSRRLKQEARRLISTVGPFGAEMEDRKNQNASATEPLQSRLLHRGTTSSNFSLKRTARWVIFRVISFIHLTILINEVNFLAERSQQRIRETSSAGLFHHGGSWTQHVVFQEASMWDILHIYSIPLGAKAAKAQAQNTSNIICKLRSKYASSWSSSEYF